MREKIQSFQDELYTMKYIYGKILSKIRLRKFLSQKLALYGSHGVSKQNFFVLSQSTDSEKGFVPFKIGVKLLIRL